MMIGSDCNHKLMPPSLKIIFTSEPASVNSSNLRGGGRSNKNIRMKMKI